MEQPQAITMTPVTKLVMAIVQVKPVELSALLPTPKVHRLAPQFFSSLLDLLDRVS